MATKSAIRDEMIGLLQVSRSYPRWVAAILFDLWALEAAQALDRIRKLDATLAEAAS